MFPRHTTSNGVLPGWTGRRPKGQGFLSTWSHPRSTLIFSGENRCCSWQKPQAWKKSPSPENSIPAHLCYGEPKTNCQKCFPAHSTQSAEATQLPVFPQNTITACKHSVQGRGGRDLSPKTNLSGLIHGGGSSFGFHKMENNTDGGSPLAADRRKAMQPGRVCRVVLCLTSKEDVKGIVPDHCCACTSF